MNKKPISAPDTLVTPEQADMKLSEKIMTRLESYIDRSERNHKNAIEFQAEPVNVLREEDVEPVVKGMVKMTEYYPEALKKVGNELKDIRTNLSDMRYIKEELTKINEIILATEAEAKEDAEQRRSKHDKILQWWDSDLGLAVRFGVFVAALLAVMFIGIHTWYWSDDAWARRAYDASSQIEEFNNPGDAYHKTRILFREERRRTAKGVVLDLENDLREQKREKAETGTEARRKELQQ